MKLSLTIVLVYLSAGVSGTPPSSVFVGLGLCKELGIRVYDGNGDNDGTAKQRTDNCASACFLEKNALANGPWSGRGHAVGFGVAESNGRCYCQHVTWASCTTDHVAYKTYDFIVPGLCTVPTAKRAGYDVTTMACDGDLYSGNYTCQTNAICADWFIGTVQHKCNSDGPLTLSGCIAVEVANELISINTTVDLKANAADLDSEKEKIVVLQQQVAALITALDAEKVKTTALEIAASNIMSECVVSA